MRSAASAARAEWVTRSTAAPRERAASSKRPRLRSAVSGSRLPVGSSARIRGLLQQCAAHSDSLAFAAGQLSGSLVGAVSQSDAFDQLFGARRQVAVGCEAGERGQEDIFENAALRQELVILEDEADVLIAEGGEVSSGQSPWILAENFEVSGRGAIESPGEVQEGTFAAAGRSADGERGSGDNFEVDGGENGEVGLSGCGSGE